MPNDNPSPRHRVWRKFRRRDLHRVTPEMQELTLAEVPVGCEAEVVGFNPHIPSNRRDHLQAYGVRPGQCLKVVQHSPVTVVRVEHTELALETSLAREIRMRFLPSETDFTV